MNNIIQLKIGDCSIFPKEFAIQFDHQEKISLQPKFIEVILYLANHYPRVISRNELIDNVWDGNYFVGEKSLTNAIWQLRKHLKAVDQEHDVIETIRKMGYRLLVEPKVLELETHNTAQLDIEIVKPKNWLLWSAFVLVALIGIYTGWYFGGPEKSHGTVIVKNVTTEPGQEFFASPSPDGRYITYRWKDSERNRNLYLRDLEQPDIPPKQLTFGNTIVGHSVWSKNGEYLFYSRANYNKGFCHIIRMSISSLKEKKITDCPTDRGYRYITISPDDQTLAYRSNHDKVLGSGIYFIDLTKENAKAVRFSCEKDCLYRDRDMAYSPDGKSLLVSRRFNALSENLFLVNIDTKQAIQLTEQEENIVGFSWHPDGERIVYSTERANVYNGYLMNLKSKNVIPLNLDGFSFPVFTRQKNPSLFYLQISEKEFISAFDLDEEIASSPFPILRSGFSHRTPDYSPITEKIAYVSNENGRYELWLSDISGKKRERLTNLKSNVRFPTWSKDGTKIAFLAQVDDLAGEKIHIIDLQSKHPTILKTPYEDHGRPSWDPGGKFLISSITQQKKTNLFKFDIEDGNPSPLTKEGGVYGVISDSGQLLYTKNEKRGLWQIDMNQNLKEPVSLANSDNSTEVISGDFFQPRYTWQTASNGVYFRQNVNNHQIISFYNLKEKKLTPIIKLPDSSSESFGKLAFVPDRRKLIFTQSGDEQGNVKKLKHPLFN